MKATDVDATSRTRILGKLQVPIMRSRIFIPGRLRESTTNKVFRVTVSE
jgi:hypothetical protein